MEIELPPPPPVGPPTPTHPAPPGPAERVRYRCLLTDDGLAGRGELGVHKAAVPPLAVVAPQPLRGAVYPQYEGLSVGEGLVWVEEGGGRGEKKGTRRQTRSLDRVCLKTAKWYLRVVFAFSGSRGLFPSSEAGGSRCFPHAAYQVSSTARSEPVHPRVICHPLAPN